MNDLKKYVLANPWEVKSGSIVIETGSTVQITENRAEQLINAGILEGKSTGAIKRNIDKIAKDEAKFKPKN